jgi:hypothetical protein
LLHTHRLSLVVASARGASLGAVKRLSHQDERPTM